MRTTTTVTQKGQITLSQAIRKQLNIAPYDTVELHLLKNHVTVKPVKDILDLAGTVKPRKNIHASVTAARDVMEKIYKRT